MEKYIMNRGAGKTAQLIKKAAESDGTIVCSSTQESMRIRQAAIDMGLSIKYPITYWDFRTQARNAAGVNGFLIDNVEMLIQSLTSKPVIAITLTPEPEFPATQKRNWVISVLRSIGATCIVNLGSKEIHRLDSLHVNCHIDMITHARYIWSEKRWLKKGYNGCRYCNAKHDKG